jgi:hypothetical protein
MASFIGRDPPTFLQFGGPSAIGSPRRLRLAAKRTSVDMPAPAEWLNIFACHKTATTAEAAKMSMAFAARLPPASAEAISKAPAMMANKRDMAAAEHSSLRSCAKVARQSA